MSSPVGELTRTESFRSANATSEFCVRAMALRFLVQITRVNYNEHSMVATQTGVLLTITGPFLPRERQGVRDSDSNFDYSPDPRVRELDVFGEHVPQGETSQLKGS